MTTRPFRVLSGDTRTMAYDLVGNFGSESAAVQRAHEVLLGLVRYGYAHDARMVVRGPGVDRRFRCRRNEGTPSGKPTFDPSNWTVEEHDAEVVITETPSRDVDAQAGEQS